MREFGPTVLSPIVDHIIVCNRTFNLEPGEYILHNTEPRSVLATLVLLVFVLGVVGNLLVIAAVIVSRRLQTTTNIFVVNLAVSDLVTALFLPAHAATLLSEDSCYIPDLLCKFVAAVTLTTLGCSIVTLALIAFTRFHVIYNVLHSKPLFKNVYKLRNIIIMVAFSWLYPIVLMCIIVPAGVGSLGYSIQYKVCSQNTDDKNSDYLSLTAGIVVQLPAFVMIIVCYALILRMTQLHQQYMIGLLSTKRRAQPDLQPDTTSTIVEDDVDGPKKSVTLKSSSSTPNHVDNSVAIAIESPQLPLDSAVGSGAGELTTTPPNQEGAGVSMDTSIPQTRLTPPAAMNGSHANGNSTNSLPDEPPINRSATLEDVRANKKQERYKQQLKITLNLFIVVCVYTVCVMPLGVAVLIPPSDPVIPWFTVLLLCNACVNPILYALKHPNFSEVFMCLLRCKYSKIPQPSGFLRRRLYSVPH